MPHKLVSTTILDKHVQLEVKTHSLAIWQSELHAARLYIAISNRSIKSLDYYAHELADASGPSVHIA
jgi:hypothetical protein